MAGSRSKIVVNNPNGLNVRFLYRSKILRPLVFAENQYGNHVTTINYLAPEFALFGDFVQKSVF